MVCWPAGALEDNLNPENAVIARQERSSIAVLDDYQNVALSLADWSVLDGRASVSVFNDHLSDADAVERLQPFDVVCVMRERTPLTRAILERLPRLRLIASTAPRNASIDIKAAAGRARHSGRSYRLDLGTDHRTDLGSYPRQRPQPGRREHLTAQRWLAAIHRR